VENNVFEGNSAGTDGGAILCLGGAATIVGNIFDSNSTGDVGAAIRYVAAGEISDNIFRDNRSTAMTKGAIVIRSGAAQGTSVIVTRNLFHDNDSAVFMRTAPATELSQNTIIRCAAGIVDLGTADAVTIANNLIVSNQAAGVDWSGALPIVTCNDVWQNTPDYAGIPDPTGTNGNISRDPLHCDPAQDDFTLHENSPCASANAGPCVLIGKFDAGCPPSAVEPSSWGRIKGAFGR
jgi:predicted outer membrane repeat protein